MIKAIRIILGLDAGGFLGGLNQSKSAWDGFTSSISGGVGSAVAFLGHLSEIVQGVQVVITGLINTAKGLYDTFIGGYAEEQRFVTQLGVLMGSADEAKGFIDRLGDSNSRLGFITDDMLPSINAGATALKAMDGAVDPAKLEKYVDILRRIKAARPDIDYDTLSRAINRFISGDTEAFKRVLGVGIEDIQGLSEASQQALQDVQGAQEAQLGQVTRVSGDAKAKSGDMLAVLDEVTDKLGMGEEAVTAYSNTWDAQIKRLEEMWDNFKDSVGAPILEALMPELKKLADWLSDHKEDIEKFAEKLGTLTAEGLVNAMEALMKVDWEEVGNGAAKLLDAMSKIDWAAVAEGVGGLAKFLGGQTPETQKQGFQELTGTNKGGANEGGVIDILSRSLEAIFGQAGIGKLSGATARGELSPEDAMKAFITANLPNLAAMQKVDVHITVDDDGKIRALAQQEAQSAVNNVIDEATKSQSGGSSSGNRH